MNGFATMNIMTSFFSQNLWQSIRRQTIAWTDPPNVFRFYYCASRDVGDKIKRATKSQIILFRLVTATIS
ncbi:hypothetical protein BJD16_01740 [Aeromonas sobria]|uniref:Uncharacterized protein n=1 Tax=Aeromonas sobria TaxID=646 RepID=A0A1S2DAD7_AERSO|nr:hypothetical protein BJD16_01740 [Aeromonas sobria]